MSKDPYVYDNTNVLKNLANIRIKKYFADIYKNYSIKSTSR